MSLHNALTTTDIHALYFKTYANAGARTGDGTLGVGDIGKLSWQTDNNTYYILQDNVGPVWVAVSSSAPTSTFLDGSFSIENTADNTKILNTSLTGATTGTTLTLDGVQTANRTLTLPDATDTLVARATTDALSNKEFTNQVLMDQIATPGGSPAAGKDYIYVKNDDKLYIKTSGGVETAIGPGGAVNSAALSLNEGGSFSVVAGNPIIFDTVVYDSAGGYNAGTGRYTVPYTGNYIISVAIVINNAGFYCYLYINGVQYGAVITQTATTLCFGAASFHASAGNLIDIRTNVSGTLASTSTMSIGKLA